MSTLPKTLLTPEEYLAIERKAERKSEFFQGEMFLMAGAQEAHNLIVAHTISSLDQQLRSRPCRVYPSDMRVCVDRVKMYAYPDVIVVCGDRKFLDAKPDTLLNPTLIVEVLSPSTEGYDRGLKFQHYRSIESLRQYLLISSDRVHADLFTRPAEGPWTLAEANGPEDVLELQSIGCVLKLADLYDKVEL
ncbi:MAG: Uma2 family endonuclease [Bryobacteraceae bacterium]